MSIPAFTDVAKASNDVSTFAALFVYAPEYLANQSSAIEQGLLPRIVGLSIDMLVNSNSHN